MDAEHGAPDDLEAILAAARSGDAAAVDALCARYYPLVERLVHRTLARDVRGRRPWLRPAFSTGDIVQEVFLGVVRDLDDVRCRTESSLLNYIATLTRHRLVDAIRFHEASRRDQRRNGAGAVEGLAGGEGPEAAAIGREQAERFRRTLATFSGRDRVLLRERIENGVPFEQLARMLGFASADSTRKAFHVAQARLVLRLRPET